MDEKLLAELANIKSGLETKTTAEVKASLDAFETKLTSEIKATFDNELKSVKEALEAKFAADLKVVQDHADKLDVKLQAKAVETENVDFLAKAIRDNIESIKVVSKDKAFSTKAVANMTTANLTGTKPRNISFDIVTLPAQMVNIEDLAGTVIADTGNYTYTREGAGEGSIGAQTEGSAKNQRDYDFTAIDVATDFIAGFARYSKKMRNNLSYIVNTIPTLLRRDYYKAENAAFQTVLAAAATASTEVITGNTKAGMLINEIGKLQDADYEGTNYIIVKPTDYLSILKTAKDDLAAAVTYENGVLRVAGVQVLKASSWLPANKYYVGDWSRVNKVVTEGLSLEFSETEGSNFVNNNITARIEAQVALAVEQPAAVIYGDFTATA
jgi:HK97 family phage major capsid protein